MVSEFVVVWVELNWLRDVAGSAFFVKRDARQACAACHRGFVGGWLLGCRNSAKTVFKKSELAACCRSDSGLLKNNADFRQPRISSPPAEADQTASPARAVRFSAVGLGWLGGRFVWSGRLSGFPVGDGASGAKG